jgi:N-acetylglutamate synthase
MTIHLVPFSIESYAEAVSLWKQSEGVTLSDADTEKSLRKYLERNPGMSFIARDDRGVIAGAILCGHDGRRGYIHHLAVHPDSRRRGIGRRLVESCLARLQAAGITKCHIFLVNENKRGLEFWKQIGWTFRADVSIVSKVIE